MTIRLTLCDANVTQQTDRHTDKPVGDLVRALPLSNFTALPFRNKGLNQNSVETLYAGNLGLHSPAYQNIRKLD